MADVELTRRAAEDVREIDQYTKAQFDAERAAAYLSGLGTMLRRLADMPGRGSRRDDLTPDTRSFPYCSHRIFYRMVGRTLRVQRIVHHAQLVRQSTFE